MAVYRVEAEAGWGGIAARLAEARPGDRIELASARFEGADTLRVPGGVTLAGLAGHDLAYTGEGVAVLVEQAACTTLERLNVTGYAGLADADEGDPDEALTVGLIRIADSRAITVADCRVAAGARRRSCVSVEASHDVKVSRCHVSGARRGVVFWNSTGGAAAAALMSQPGSAARIATWLAQSPERRLEAIEARLLREALAAG